MLVLRGDFGQVTYIESLELLKSMNPNSDSAPRVLIADGREYDGASFWIWLGWANYSKRRFTCSIDLLELVSTSPQKICLKSMRGKLILKTNSYLYLLF